QALEGDLQIMALKLIGKAAPPFGLQPHDVVHEPDIVWRRGFDQGFKLGHDALWTANGITLAPNRLGAPIAGIGTASGRGHVDGEHSVAIAPYPAIALEVHQVPSRWRQRIEIAQGRAPGRSDNGAAGAADGDAFDTVKR